MKDGGPAFPQLVRREEKYMDEFGSGRTRIVTLSEGGLSLRDYFAAKAMAALISATPNAPHTGPFDDEPIAHYRGRVAYGSYQWADAMLAARESKP